MSKYTTEVRYICEVEAGIDESVGYDSVDNVIISAAPKVFNFNFPIFDEAYRLPLEIKILRHYYTREISEETVGLWKLRLETKMNEIMPYYNKLYASETLKFNPLWDTDLTRDYNKKTDGESQNSGTDVTSRGGKDTRTNDLLTTDRGTVVDAGNNNNTRTLGTTHTNTDNTNTWDLYSDTPQGGINGLLDDGIVETGGDLDNNTYLTNARHIIEDGSTHVNEARGTVKDAGSNGNTRTLNTDTHNGGTVEEAYNSHTDIDYGKKNEYKNADEYIEHVKGKTGGYTFSKALQEYRKTLLNIDMQIIDELKGLFFGLW